MHIITPFVTNFHQCRKNTPVSVLLYFIIERVNYLGRGASKGFGLGER